MRVLTRSECEMTSGSAFIEGFIIDDFIVGGAVVGFVGAMVLGVYAPSFYKDGEIISFKHAVTCTIGTARYGAIAGIIPEVIYTGYKLYNKFF